jgi:hypothetical protein
MKLLLKILFFLVTIFYTNISEAKVFVFDNVVSEIKFSIDEVENTNDSKLISENDFGITCKSGSKIVDYRNLVLGARANAAKGVASGAQYSVAFETKLASNLYR